MTRQSEVLHTTNHSGYNQFFFSLKEEVEDGGRVNNKTKTK